MPSYANIDPAIPPRILIIKLAALGDVLRTTPVLRRLRDRYPSAHITWVTSQEATPLLANHLLDEVFAVSSLQDGALDAVAYDLAVNFDEDRVACGCLEQVNAGVKKGYLWNRERNMHWPADADAEYGWRLSQDDELKFRLNRRSYQSIAFELLGERFAGEDYVLPDWRGRVASYDVALNYMVGEKFLTKSWPHWTELADGLSRRGVRVSMQQRFETLEAYAAWLAGSRVVVTGDSLGMHLGLAMRKPTVILMGSTSESEIELYGVGEVINRHLDCSPCYRRACPVDHHDCMVGMAPAEIAGRALAKLAMGRASSPSGDAIA